MLGFAQDAPPLGDAIPHLVVSEASPDQAWGAIASGLRRTGIGFAKGERKGPVGRTFGARSIRFHLARWKGSGGERRNVSGETRVPRLPGFGGEAPGVAYAVVRPFAPGPA